MTDREKLVELLAEKCSFRDNPCKGCECMAIAPKCREEAFGEVADHLIANGVTVNIWRDARTDPPPIGKEVVMLFSDESTAIGWLEDIEEDGEPLWNICAEKGWYTTSPCCPEKWQPRPALPKKKEE